MFTKDDFIRPPRPNQIGKVILTHVYTTTINPIVSTSDEDGAMTKLTQDEGHTSMKNKVDSE